ncbi:MAG: metal-sensitive transcriptional regulator [Acidimicrobiales bacterium]|nr:metal-sensitive transcriptional regulator [Acidimicrobiales bacterium]
MTSQAERHLRGCGSPPGDGEVERPTRGCVSGKDDYLARLGRIEGQVRGLQKMIEDDRWCPHVVTQVAAATRALQEVAVGLLNDHLHHCGGMAARSSAEEGADRFDEVASTIRQVVRL